MTKYLDGDPELEKIRASNRAAAEKMLALTLQRSADLRGLRARATPLDDEVKELDNMRRAREALTRQ